MPETRRVTGDRVLRIVKRLLDANEIARPFSTSDRLSEIGLGSMDMVNLMLEVEAEFDLTIPQNDITPDNFQSIATIEALITRLDIGASPA